jgi:hypothetical protein
MDFLLGVLGVLQITLIPGLIARKVLKSQGNLVDGILMVFGLSLITNYCAIFLLTIFGIYTQAMLGVLVVAEMLALMWIYREEFKMSVWQFLEFVWDEIKAILAVAFPEKKNGNGVWILYYFFVSVFALIAVKDIFWLVNVFIKNFGSVFSTWDAVVSWNRWAGVWFSGEIPMDSHFYPQLIPLNWSITYVLMGDTAIQFFAKGIMPLFALALVVALFNLAITTAQYYFFISAVVMGVLLRGFLSAQIVNGYVDVASAFFTFMAIYMLIRARTEIEMEQQNRLLILGAVFAAAAAVTKQTGVYIVLCYPVLALVVMGLQRPLDRDRLKKFSYHFAIISLVWISWYLYKQFQILLGVDRPNLDVLIDLSADKYEAANIFQQILVAIGQYPQLVFLLIVTIVAFPLMDRFYKALAVLFAPYPILWAWIAGYDVRNLAIFLPLLALLSGYALHQLSAKILETAGKIQLFRLPLYLPIALAVAGLVYVNTLASPPKLLSKQETLQKQIFSPSKNEMLYDLVATSHPQMKILTNYPMAYLPGLEQYQVRFNFQDYNIFLAHVDNPLIEYIFFPNAMDDSVEKYINEKLENGDYELIVKDTQWKAYTLVRILNH